MLFVTFLFRNLPFLRPHSCESPSTPNYKCAKKRAHTNLKSGLCPSKTVLGNCGHKEQPSGAAESQHNKCQRNAPRKHGCLTESCARLSPTRCVYVCVCAYVCIDIFICCRVKIGPSLGVSSVKYWSKSSLKNWSKLIF